MFEKNFSLLETYGAGEAFLAGFLGGLTCVSEIDGWRIGEEWPGATTRRLGALYAALIDKNCGG